MLSLLKSFTSNTSILVSHIKSRCEGLCNVWTQEWCFFCLQMTPYTQGLAPGLSLSIILTLLSMCGTKIKIFQYRTLIAPGLSLSIILTLLSMCGTKIKIFQYRTLIVGLKLLITKGREQVILVPHIDSRVKIIDNERPGASPCAYIRRLSHSQT